MCVPDPGKQAEQNQTEDLGNGSTMDLGKPGQRPSGIPKPSPMGLFGLSLSRDKSAVTTDTLKNPWRWGL